MLPHDNGDNGADENDYVGADNHDVGVAIDNHVVVAVLAAAVVHLRWRCLHCWQRNGISARQTASARLIVVMLATQKCVLCKIAAHFFMWRIIPRRFSLPHFTTKYQIHLHELLSYDCWRVRTSVYPAHITIFGLKITSAQIKRICSACWVLVCVCVCTLK